MHLQTLESELDHPLQLKEEAKSLDEIESASRKIVPDADPAKSMRVQPSSEVCSAMVVSPWFLMEMLESLAVAAAELVCALPPESSDLLATSVQ